MIGEWTNHLWQSTLFAVAAGLMTVAFRKNRAQVRYWLWFTASFKFLVPFSLLVSLGSNLDWAPAARNFAAPVVSSAIEQVTQPFPEAMSLTSPTRDDGEQATFRIVPILIGLWVCGFAGVTLIRFRGWLRIRAAVRSSTPADIPAPVAVRFSPGLLEPGVVGLLRPILLLPAGIAERLAPSQLGAVLAHELCHIRRYDNLLASIHMIVEAIFWFHPPVWWIGARLLQERERACDEGVLSLGSEPHVYAEAILNVCKLYVESPLTCVAGVTGADLRKRIEAILANRIALRLNFAKKVVLGIAGAGALAIPVLVGMMKAPLVSAQTPAGVTANFEVASIRPCRDEPGRRRGVGEISPGRLNTGCTPLVDEKSLGLIQRAYVRFADGQLHWTGIVPIEGGPSWIRSELYTINAAAESNPSQATMQGPMLRALLEERFKLKLHRETREVPVYELKVGDGGHRLKPFQEGSCIMLPLTAPRPTLPPGQQHCKVMVDIRRPAVSAQGSTLGEFSKLLDLVLDRPVIDKTGISGRFDIRLEFARDEATAGLHGLFANADPSAVRSEPDAPSIFAALQQQLGLKFVPGRGPREFIVIDHVERPSEN